MSLDEGRELAAHFLAAATGFRPDLHMLRELRLDLDPAVEAPSQLAPLIDPQFHSFGTVESHGAQVLAHPEADFFIDASRAPEDGDAGGGGCCTAESQPVTLGVPTGLLHGRTGA